MQATASPSENVSSTSSRSTGENLFSAKKAPARKKFQYRLGIIPTAIIIGTVLGIAGSIYVWLEIQPPRPVQYRSPPPVAVANDIPAQRTISNLSLAPETLPEPPVSHKFFRPAPAPEKQVKHATVKRVPAAEAEQGIQIQRQLDNNDLYSTLTTAYQAYQRGDFNTAWLRYRDVLQKEPKNRDALLGMAAIAQQQGQDESAIQYYRQVLTLDPRDSVALAGMSGFSTSNTASKESRLKQSLAQSPQSAALHFALGNVYTENSRWGDAQQAYSNAYSLEPANAQFAFNLATTLDHLGQRKLAAQYYEKALRLDTTGYNGFDRVQTQQRLNLLIAP